MIRKTTIAYFIFTIAVCYIITPWFFERNFFFNEILAITGLLVLAYKRFKIGNDTISICMVLLLTWSGLHLITSISRQESIYYYFRNSVIAYSMLAFFIGFYLLKYLSNYLSAIRRVLRYYIGFFLFIKAPTLLFERYGVSALFPALFKNARYRFLPMALIIMNIIYGFTYDSATAFAIAFFLFLIFISPGYKFFTQTIIIMLIAIVILFLYLQPDLARIKNQFNTKNNKAISEVMHSNPLLAIDGNTTWRLVIWEQIVVEKFPSNLFGIGFGTPMLKYYPIEDYKKLSALPYVMGGHNSFVYLFGRLGIIFLLLIIPVFITVFGEYFYNKQFYYANNQVLIFWSFFIITVMALFNPILESPMFASAYWMLLGFTARCIYNRKLIEKKLSTTGEDPIHT
jgi:hypothetical protein